jgi:uncharacterized protein
VKARAPFHVLVKPCGAHCNLGCGYCFYSSKLGLYPRDTPARMSDEVLERFTRAYLEAQPAGTREVEFAWQGGEPTLAGLDFFRKALELQRRHARPGLRVTNSLQTNGVLLDDEWARFLATNGFLVGLSLDGPRDLHDLHRLDQRGRPTHALVLRALRRLARHGVEFNVLAVVHARNAAEPERVYDFFVEQGVRYLQLIPLVEPLEEGGGASARSVGADAYGEFLSRLFDRWLLRRHVGRIFVRDFDSLLAALMGLPGSSCTSSEHCGRCLALERTGDLFACDHFVDFNHHLGRIGEQDLGAMVEGSQLRRFGLEKSASLPAACRACEHLRLCFGGCPKDRIATTADGEPGLNHLCAGYRRFFAHASPVLERMATGLRAGRPAAEWAAVPAALGGAPRERA